MSTARANGRNPLDLVDHAFYSGTGPRTAGTTHVGRFLGTVAHLGASSPGGRPDPEAVRRAGLAEYQGGAGGGFLVPFGVAQAIFDKSRETDGLLARSRYLPSQIHEFSIPCYAETARGDGDRWGGILARWQGALDAPPSMSAIETGPRAAEIRFTQKTLIVFSEPISNDLIADSSLIMAFFDHAAFSEIRFQVERSMVSGDGVGKPLGILNSPATATIAKDSGQTAATISATNISGMWKALWGPCRRTAVWLAADDTIEEIDAAAQLAGWPANVYLPQGAAGNPYPLLRGRPLLPCEACPALGAAGDLILVDPSQVGFSLLNSRPTGEMPAAPQFEVAPVGSDRLNAELSLSSHALFDTDQTLLRYKIRCDAKLLWSGPITPLNGGASRHPAAVIATRA